MLFKCQTRLNSQLRVADIAWQLVGAHVPACTHNQGPATPALCQKTAGLEITALLSQGEGCGQGWAERAVPLLDNVTFPLYLTPPGLLLAMCDKNTIVCTL